MPHDPTKVLLGATGSNIKDVSEYPVNPATFPAGTAVRAAANGGLQTEDDSVAALVGISLGRSLSNDQHTAVARNGLRIPLIQKPYYAKATLAISDYSDMITAEPAAADTVTVGLGEDAVTIVAQSGAATPGTAFFQAATSNEATATSIAAQINAHADTKGLVEAEAVEDNGDWFVVITAKDPGPAGNDIVAVWGDETTNTAAAFDTSGTLEGGVDGAAEHGKAVYVNDDGHGCLSTDDDASATGAVYNGGTLTGVKEDGTTVTVALVDIMGAL